ncbi:unnamed protein product [Nyctereutes procyonoides]|uniref:(raccoon dog) hypothetical protein n=1 Tax=Nyctereutes procyonoides TaxID=34880 RepID=A0A811YCF6_NYCPR|nr:unnamed protein product [Nyctereutes procyonoides]
MENHEAKKKRETKAMDHKGRLRELSNLLKIITFMLEKGEGRETGKSLLSMYRFLVILTSVSLKRSLNTYISAIICLGLLLLLDIWWL